MGDFESLSAVIARLFSETEALASLADPAELTLHLQAFKDRFLHHLEFKGPNAASKQQVESLSVKSAKHGELRLDAEPDRRLALQLSSALGLDELLCVDYLVTAYNQRGSCTAEAAAGVFFTERQAEGRCLMRLLSEVAQQVVLAPDASRSAYAVIVHDFVVNDLLGRKAPDGSPVLVSRLIDVLKETRLDVHPSSDLQEVLDEAGLYVNRAALLALERRMVAKSLLYCLVIDQRVGPEAAAGLLDLHAAHLARVQPALALTPQEERGAQERQQLQALLGSQTLRAKVFPAGSPPPGTPATAAPPGQPGGLPQHAAGPTAVLRLAWALLLAGAVTGAGQPADEARKLLAEAPAAGVFTFLKQVVQGPLFAADDTGHQDVVAACLYQLVGQALQADTRLDSVLFRALVDRQMACVQRTQGGGLAFAPLPADSPLRRVEHLGTVMSLLAAAFTAAPRLYLEPDAGVSPDLQRATEMFITRTVTHDAMKVSPELRVPFYELMTSLAAGEYGVSLVLRQFAEMGRTPALEVLTWRKLLTTTIEYCVRYNTVLEQLSRAAGGGGGGVPALMVRGQEERLMNTYECDILVAGLGLLRQVIEVGGVADVRGFLEGLERELAGLLTGFPLTEPLFQLMCHPAPNAVKAALDRVLSAIAGRFPETAGPRLLDRLTQAVVVAPAAPAVPGVPRLDLVTQLNEVEARREEYPETLAFIQLLNSLVAAALLRPAGRRGGGGPGSSPAAAAAPTGGNGGADLAHFTGFVVQHVLAHLWQRGYRRPAQKWQVAAVALQHVELMLEVAAQSGSPPGAPTDKQAPGWSILHDLLSSGPTLQALIQVLGPGFSEISTSAVAPAPLPEDGAAATVDSVSAADAPLVARQAATLAALRVLNRALALDVGFVAVTGTLTPPVRYQTLDTLLDAAGNGRLGAGSLALALYNGGGGGVGGQLMATLLEYACYQDSDQIQVEAILLALELSARHPGIVDTLVADDRADALRRGIAIALRASLSDLGACDDLEEAAADRPVLAAVPGGSFETPIGPSSADVRAALVLRLLLRNVDAPAAPSLTHLLLGYDCEPTMGGVAESVLVPSVEYSCLTVIERSLCDQNCSLSATKPQLYAAMLRLLHAMATRGPGAPSMVELLAPRNSDLLPSLRAVLLAPLPSSERVMETAAALHQKSFIMRLQALLLLRLDHAESANALLSDALAPAHAAGPAAFQEANTVSDSSGGGSGGMAGSTLVAVLDSVWSLRPKEPALGDLTPEVRRLQADMAAGDVSVEALLVQPHVQAATGVLMQNDAGDVLFDVPRLYSLLVQRYEQYVQRSGGGGGGGAVSEPALAALRETLSYVQRFNAHALLAGAQAAAAEGWMQLTEVAFTARYNRLAGLLPGATPPADATYEVLMASLQTASNALTSATSSGAPGLAATLVNVSRILLSKLQELAVAGLSLGQASDPLLGVRTPARCLALLRALLELLSKGQGEQAVRVQLYAATLQYLQFCRGSKMAGCAPVVLKAVLHSLWGGGSGSVNGTDSVMADGRADDAAALSAVARLDASQQAIEAGNAALINAHGPTLVSVIVRDALDASGPQLQQAVALRLLASLISAAASADSVDGTVSTAPPSSSLLGALYQHAVPQTLLGCAGGVPPGLVASPARASRRAVIIVAAQLSLLGVLVQAGESPKARQAAAQALYMLQPIQFLVSCRAVDLEPEEPGAPGGTSAAAQGGDSLRQRLRRLLCPMLRLVLGLLSALPESGAVLGDARTFVAAHARTLERVLREAASSGVGDWAPGEGELEQAELATSLLARLVPVWDQLGPVHAEALRAALYRLAATFGILDTKSTSPIVRSLHMAGGGASGGAGTGKRGAGVAISVSPSNRAALLARAARVAALRASLARFLRDTVAAAPAPALPATPATPGASSGGAPQYGGPGVPFRCLGNPDRPEVDPYTNRPTLLLVRDMAEQACLDAAAALEELDDLLALLRAPDHQLDDRTCVQKLLDYGPPDAAPGLGLDESVGGASVQPSVMLPGGLQARRRLTRHFVALAASQLDGLLGRALYILESSLAVVVLHFLRYLPRSASEDGAGGLAAGGGEEEALLAAAEHSLGGAGGAAQQAGQRLLGSPSDLAYLATRLQETCLKAEELLAAAGQLGLLGLAPAGGVNAGGAGTGARHRERFQGVDLMARTVKSFCARL